MADESAASCVFCRIVRRELTPDVVAFATTTRRYSRPRQQPLNRGPYARRACSPRPAALRHRSDLAGPLMTTLARVAAAVKLVSGAHGVSVRQNNERHGGQDVFHVHFHVIPRFADDEFNSGDKRFPYGLVEVPLVERIRQATELSEALRKIGSVLLPRRFNIRLNQEDVVCVRANKL